MYYIYIFHVVYEIHYDNAESINMFDGLANDEVDRYLDEHPKIVPLFEVDMAEAVTPYVTYWAKEFNEPDQEAIRELKQAQEILTLKDELAAEDALREKEREQKKTVKEERRRIEENLRKSHAKNDRLKEERKKLLQDKDKLRRMAKAEIARLKEELWQQKDREDWTRSEINRRLKKKTDDFEKLYREHKQMEAE